MRVPIDSIVVEERRRQEMGDIDDLARSIQRWGLIHPPVIDTERHLIAGGRRLEACKRLGWAEIDVQSRGVVTSEDRRALELEENVQRKDLTPLERSRQMLDRAVQAEEEILRERATGEEVFLADKNTPSGGRPTDGAVGLQAIGKHLGVSHKSVWDAKQHMAAVTRYPELANPAVSRREALEVAKELDRLPEKKRAPVLTAIATRPADAPPRRRAPQPPVRKAPRPNRTLADLPSMTRFVKCLGQLEEALAGLAVDGGLIQGLARWPEADRGAQLADVRRLAAALTAAASEEGTG